MSQYMEVKLVDIGPNPWNPRKDFDLEGLVESVRQQGVLEPILLRPCADGPVIVGFKEFPTYGRMVAYQLVAGERRFRALWNVATENGKQPDFAVIPAIVMEDLSDDAAFEITMVENLQRKNLNEYEEAQSFRAWAQQRGEESIPDLADRIGVHPRYVRRRIRVLMLPDEVLQAWREKKIKYSYLEQLIRLEDEQEILALAEEILGHSWRFKSVRELKRYIDDRAIPLEDALFPVDVCAHCANNSLVQQELFIEDVLNEAYCLNRHCYKQRLNNWLLAHWQETEAYKKHQTQGFRFDDAIAWCDRHYFNRKPWNECRKCESFINVISLRGQFSDPICIKKKCPVRDKKEKLADRRLYSTPTHKWQALQHRLKFYAEQMPLKLAPLRVIDEQVMRLNLLVLLIDHNLLAWCGETYFGWDDAPRFNATEEQARVWSALRELDAGQVDEILKQSVIHALRAGISLEIIAQDLDIDIRRDWRLDEAYLDGKDKKALLALGKELNIFDEDKAKAFLYETLNKKRGAFKGCSKPELIRVFLESGVDLAGRIPAEVLEGLDEGKDE